MVSVVAAKLEIHTQVADHTVLIFAYRGCDNFCEHAHHCVYTHKSIRYQKEMNVSTEKDSELRTHSSIHDDSSCIRKFQLSFTHSDDNAAFETIHYTLLSMNNLANIVPDCILKIIAYLATGEIINCDGCLTNEILFLKSNEHAIQLYRFYQQPSCSNVKLCMECINCESSVECILCHNIYPKNLTFKESTLDESWFCIDCSIYRRQKIVWGTISTRIERIISAAPSLDLLTSENSIMIAKMMLSTVIDKAVIKLYVRCIEKKISKDINKRIQRDSSVQTSTVSHALSSDHGKNSTSCCGGDLCDQ